MFKNILIFLFATAILDLYGQGVDKAASPKRLNRIFDEWKTGKVFFKNGDTIACEFTYSPLVPGGLLKIKENGSIKTFTAKSIDGYSYFDQEKHAERKFITLNTNDIARFFEVLFEYQTFSLLGEQAITIRKTRYVDANYTTSTVKGKYSKYILDVQKWKYFVMNKKNLLALMSDRGREIDAYIKSNKIRLKRIDDYINVIVEYSRIKQNS